MRRLENLPTYTRDTRTDYARKLSEERERDKEKEDEVRGGGGGGKKFRCFFLARQKERGESDVRSSRMEGEERENQASVRRKERILENAVQLREPRKINSRRETFCA